jgi:BirA family transcriptional regulator, biotin operon repressor / biotin---[acetyl-CoA-carboxylase] ligase
VLSQDSLEKAISGAGIDAPPRYLDETPSTNTVALALAEEGAPEWTVVAAGHQTAGRGRLGRAWASVPGRSLLFSVVLRPPLPPERAPLLSLLAAAEMVEVCPRPPEEPVRAKWPNDLLVGERKVGGILPEARVEGNGLRHLVLGVGMNVSMTEEDFPEEILVTATSLGLEGASIEPGDLLGRFLAGFRASYRPIDPDFGLHVVAAYQAVCATIGRLVRARTVAGDEVEGLAVAVDRDGSLVLEREGERHSVAFGEVAHLD